MIREARQKWRHINGDHFTLFNVFSAYMRIDEHDRPKICEQNCLNHYNFQQALLIREQLETIVFDIFKVQEYTVNHHLYSKYYDNIMHCLLNGFFLQVAYYDCQQNEYIMFDVMELDNQK